MVVTQAAVKEKIKKLKEDLPRLLLFLRPDTITLGITTTQACESCNYHRLKVHMNKRSSIFDMAVLLSSCDYTFDETLKRHY